MAPFKNKILINDTVPDCKIILMINDSYLSFATTRLKIVVIEKKGKTKIISQNSLPISIISQN